MAVHSIEGNKKYEEEVSTKRGSSCTSVLFDAQTQAKR